MAFQVVVVVADLLPYYFYGNNQVESTWKRGNFNWEPLDKCFRWKSFSKQIRSHRCVCVSVMGIR